MTTPSAVSMPRLSENLRALNRFGLGARPGEPGTLSDAREWLERQLVGLPPALTGAPGPAETDDVWPSLATLRTARRDRDQEAVRAARQRIVEVASLEAQAALTERVASERPFVERLVAFWSNHLCVSAGAKLVVAPLAGRYEREAIRPRVLGRFEDLVLASARHPAMLLYLDNAQSVGPGSRLGRVTARRSDAPRGLNENYARELLELHTLGVDGGYTQEDVIELARLLTGWTVAGLRGPGRRAGLGPTTPGFEFVPATHEPGAKTVLGVRYQEGGAEEANAAIRDLCRHPATARHVAGKLVRHFVADDPPPADVERVATVFRDTGGDLREVARSVVYLESAWDASNRKFRTPQDWLVAALRAFGARKLTAQLAGALRDLRQPLWAPPAPKGYGDTRDEWADPDALMNRAELARTIGRRIGRADSDPTRLLDVVEVDAASPLPVLLGDRTIDVGERIALALAGPDFQWR
jgi:uncharacterized protein (DUF1800 family)